MEKNVLTVLWSKILSVFVTRTQMSQGLNSKQDTLVGGTNIKTINGKNILGSGDMSIIESYAPTLPSAPTSSTLTYTKDNVTVNFGIGQFCRVANAQATSGYDFYQLFDLATSNNVTTAKWEKVENIYASSELVSIVCTTDVVGASVSGLVINVYYNDAPTPTTTVTTDANGMASLRVPYLTKYKLVFPSVQGCEDISPVVHVAAVAQRSVEVEYAEETIEGELVKIVLTQYTGVTESKVSGATVNVTVDGATTSYTTDSIGEVMLTVPYGKQYTVTAPQREGWYLHENKYSVTFTADQTQQIILYKYRQFESGLFIVASDGAEYTLEQWESAVEEGTRENSEAKLIKVTTGALVQAGGVFAVGIDMLRDRSYGANKIWASQNVQFNSVPLNGNSISANYYYDGLTASRLIQQEGNERAIDTPAADKCLELGMTLAEGTENEIILPGFLGSVGQWNELWLNAVEVDDILLSVRPNGTNLLSTLNTQKWTSTQSNAGNAWLWGSSAVNNPKSLSFVVLPFFAY